ncbi:hypothetical protein BDB13_5877 [Rhodococcus sp. OK302]|nr:hypothetical protein BDB13_5877 [Rhodococcus sp. OK302]
MRVLGRRQRPAARRTTQEPRTRTGRVVTALHRSPLLRITVVILRGVSFRGTGERVCQSGSASTSRLDTSRADVSDSKQSDTSLSRRRIHGREARRTLSAYRLSLAGGGRQGKRVASDRCAPTGAPRSQVSRRWVYPNTQVSVFSRCWSQQVNALPRPHPVQEIWSTNVLPTLYVPALAANPGQDDSADPDRQRQSHSLRQLRDSVTARRMSSAKRPVRMGRTASCSAREDERGISDYMHHFVSFHHLRAAP